MIAIKDKEVLVIGLAQTGVSAAFLLQSLGARVTVNDGSSTPDSKHIKDLLDRGIEVITGSHPVALLDRPFSLVIKNPGIPYQIPIIQKLQEKGTPIWTDIELAYQISPSPIIAITGSNGKTTVTRMVEEVLASAGKSPIVCGNIGIAATSVVKKATSNDLLVMEVSSFQLMGISEFRPQIAIMTNISPTHLDYHKTNDAYIAAKWRIQENMTADDVLIYNADDPVLSQLVLESSATLVPFSRSHEVSGSYQKSGDLYYGDEFVMSASDIGVPGDHNIDNALATIALARHLRIPRKLIRSTLHTFAGVVHRLQYLGALSGVAFYNDSKSTNGIATLNALSGFVKEKVILIAGGLDRGNSFEDLLPIFTGLKGLVLVGETREKMAKIAAKIGTPFQYAQDVHEAAYLAFQQAVAGDVVLLSPASASWDQYQDFEERGNHFMMAFDELQKG